MKIIDPVDAFAFAVRVVTDHAPMSTDAAYLFAQTGDNALPVIRKGAFLHLHGFAHKIALLDMGSESGYEGFVHWRELLVDHDVPVRNMQAILRTKESLSNTFTEAQELVRFAKHEQWSYVICVAPAFHLPRAFLGAVTVVLQEYPALNVYAVCADHLFWTQSVVHSQGTTTGTRAELLVGEFERIVKYDNLIHPREALQYLDERERRG